MQITESTRRKFRKPFGALLVGLAGVAAYLTMYRPLQVARHTGSLQFYFKALPAGPTLLALGVLLLFTNLKDVDLRRTGANGRPTFTAKGWWFIGAFIALLAITYAAFWWAARSLGFDILSASPTTP